MDTLLRIAGNTRAGGNLSSAATLYRRAHLLELERVEPLVELGTALNGMGAKRDAVEAFRMALAIDSKQVRALRELANTLLTLNQPELAYKEFKKNPPAQQGGYFCPQRHGRGI